MSRKNLMVGGYRENINIIHSAISNGDVEEACSGLSRMIYSATKRQGSDMKLIPVPDLDKRFEMIGDILGREQDANPVRGRGIVFVTSKFLKTGGHSREIEDWVGNLHKQAPVKVLISEHIRFSDCGSISRLEKVAEFLTHDQTTYSGAIRWIVSTLTKENPATIVISPGAEDIALFVAVSKLKIGGIKILNLNLDHGVSPGIFISAVDKVLARRIYVILFLTDNYGLKNVIYRPLTRTLTSLSDEYNPTFKSGLISFSCTSSSQKITPFYGDPFDEVVSSMIIRCNSKHVHVGAISTASLLKIRSALREAGREDGFVHLEFANSLIDVFREYGVNTLIQTFPVGGGLVSLEAMRSGLMIVNHSCYMSHLHNYVDFCYPGAIVWRSRELLYEELNLIGEEDFAMHTRKSKECFRLAVENSRIEDMLINHDFKSAPYDADFFRKAYSHPLDTFRMQFEAPVREKPGSSLGGKIRRELGRLFRQIKRS
jgi:hypothetical protein